MLAICCYTIPVKFSFIEKSGRFYYFVVCIRAFVSFMWNRSATFFDYIKQLWLAFESVRLGEKKTYVTLAKRGFTFRENIYE